MPGPGRKPHFVLANEIKLLLLCGWLQRMYLPTNKNLAGNVGNGEKSAGRYLIMAGCGGYGYFDYSVGMVSLGDMDGGNEAVDDDRADSNGENDHWIDKISINEEQFQLENDTFEGQDIVESEQNFGWTDNSDFQEGGPLGGDDGGGWMAPQGEDVGGWLGQLVTREDGGGGDMGEGGDGGDGGCGVVLGGLAA